MKIIDVLKFNRELIKRLRIVGIRLEDEQFVDLYTDYTVMRQGGEKSLLHRSRAGRSLCYK